MLIINKKSSSIILCCDQISSSFALFELTEGNPPILVLHNTKVVAYDVIDYCPFCGKNISTQIKNNNIAIKDEKTYKIIEE